MVTDATSGLMFGQTKAVGKLHIVQSSINPTRVMSVCGKVLTDSFYYTTTMKETKVCAYCEYRYMQNLQRKKLISERH